MKIEHVERLRDEEPEVDNWVEMRRVMRKRYVPTSYNRTLRLKLQKLSQGSMTVEEYYKEMEMALMRANMEEDNEAKMTYFLRTRNIKCFKCLGRRHIASKCPTRRTMIIKDDEDIISESLASEEEENEEIEEEPLQGDILMVRRLLGSQMQPLEQKCSINGKLCSLIVDGGSCKNVASSRLVSKLNLKTNPHLMDHQHPRPYKLQWLSEDGEIMVSQ
uniref:Retrotransposon gag domain-containing protein n=1 Tax=Cajanus cajan TaxID=3821 RepID=A0A151RJC3_CAJCA|nr:hypothetical protein KK1_035935 [Cajanus cajan]